MSKRVNASDIPENLSNPLANHLSPRTPHFDLGCFLAKNNKSLLLWFLHLRLGFTGDAVHTLIAGQDGSSKATFNS